MKLTTHLSTPRGWKAELALLADLQQTVYPYKWLPISCGSSADQWKFADRRPTFYHWATQPGQGLKWLCVRTVCELMHVPVTRADCTVCCCICCAVLTGVSRVPVWHRHQRPLHDTSQDVSSLCCSQASRDLDLGNVSQSLRYSLPWGTTWPGKVRWHLKSSW